MQKRTTKEANASEVPAIKVAGTEIITTQSTSIEEQAKAFLAIESEEQFAKAAECYSSAKALLNQVEDTFKPHIEAAHKQHKALIATSKKFSLPLQNVIGKLSIAMGRFSAAQEQKRKQAEAELQQKAAKQQEETLLAQAAVYEQEGRHAEAEQLLEEAIEAPPPAVEVEKFKASDHGLSSRSYWYWEFVDITKLPLKFLVVKEDEKGRKTEISTSGIGALVRAVKDDAVDMCNGAIRVWAENKVV